MRYLQAVVLVEEHVVRSHILVCNKRKREEITLKRHGMRHGLEQGGAVGQAAHARRPQRSTRSAQQAGRRRRQQRPPAEALPRPQESAHLPTAGAPACGPPPARPTGGARPPRPPPAAPPAAAWPSRPWRLPAGARAPTAPSEQSPPPCLSSAAQGTAVHTHGPRSNAATRTA